MSATRALTRIGPTAVQISVRHLTRILLCWSLLIASSWAQLPPQHPVRMLDHAEFVASDAATPPERGWTPVTLPDNWRLRRPQLSGIAWYRLRFNMDPVPRQPQALYVPRLALIGEIWLNGSLLNPDVRFDEPGRRGVSMDNAPVYIVLPSGLFRAGQNVLEVRLQGDRHVRSGLSAIRLGPATELHAIWFQRFLLQVVTPYVLLVLTGGALCFVYAYTLRQRRFSPIQLALLAGIAALASYLMLDIPVSRGDQQAIRAMLTTVLYWLLCISGYRLSTVRLPGTRAVIQGVSILTLAVLVGAMIHGEVTDRIWYIYWPLIAVQLIVIVLLVLSAWRQRSAKLFLLAASAAFWEITIVQSIAILMEWLPWDSFRWSVAGALPFCIVLLFFFAERFILDREEAIREQRAAINAERGRILQDMHDGMGAQLITATRLARRPDVDRQDVARVIEESLQDMRLIIDSLDLAGHDLLPLLGNLRFRLQPRLAALDIRMEWDVEPLPELDDLSPESALAVLRIVQEAINNAVRHAQPDHIRITVRAGQQQIIIRVHDNGRGFDDSASTGHTRGMTNMRLRARKLGAALEVHSQPARGTEVTLTIPRRLTA